MADEVKVVETEAGAAQETTEVVTPPIVVKETPIIEPSLRDEVKLETQKVKAEIDAIVKERYDAIIKKLANNK